MPDEFDVERLCRLNGKEPTAREKWRALHRLYRLSRRGGVYQDAAADECFRVLWSDWRPFQLLDGDGFDQLVNTRRFPPVVRWRFAEVRRRKRLYGDHPEWAARDKVVARHLRAEGVEVTPLEVAEVRRKVITMAREKAAEMGVRVPADDDALLRLLKPDLGGEG